MIRTVALAVLSISMAAGVASADQRPSPDRGGWWTGGNNPQSAPELDPGSVMSGLTLLLGGLTVLRAGRRKDTDA
jgi:hypothetical protein